MLPSYWYGFIFIFPFPTSCFINLSCDISTLELFYFLFFAARPFFLYSDWCIWLCWGRFVIRLHVPWTPFESFTSQFIRRLCLTCVQLKRKLHSIWIQTWVVLFSSESSYILLLLMFLSELLSGSRWRQISHPNNLSVLSWLLLQRRMTFFTYARFWTIFFSFILHLL